MSQPLANDSSGWHIPSLSVAMCLRNKSLHYACERPTIRFGPGRQVASHLRVETSSLASGRVESSIWCEIREHNDQAFFQRHEPYEIHKEGFAGAILTNNESNCRPSVGDPVHVLDQFLDFASASHLDMLQAKLGYDACT